MINFIVKSSIRMYQKWLSPVKGYRCAHAAYYGGESCSSFGYKAVSDHGLLYFITAMYSRLINCRKAAILLNENNSSSSGSSNGESGDENGDGKEAAKEIAACCISIFPTGK
ncbi:MAG: membrane protein insertion efficiency factor YidD [Sedimenticola sp.]